MNISCRKNFYKYLGLPLILIGIVLLLPTLTAQAAGAAPISEKSGNMSVIYGITTLLSLGLLFGYCWLNKKKDLWSLLLYIAIFVVNLGYFSLSISKSLDEAMLANRIAYLGSVLLPLCMLMIIMDACRIKCRKSLMVGLICISAAIFLLAASGGYLNVYYKQVALEFINGVATLKKEYGPLHCLYLVYLLSYFAAMVGTIVYSVRKKRIVSYKFAVLLACIVLSNMAIWFVEQLIDWDFEFLSVSYIMTGLFLMLLFDMMQDYAPSQPIRQVIQNAAASIPEDCQDEDDKAQKADDAPTLSEERVMQILEHWPGRSSLTTREMEVLKLLLLDKRRKDMAQELFVSENTVKKHTSNIYFKLNVSNRRELLCKLDEETPFEPIEDICD
ncbi:MAG: hypothetical protein E7464_08270 [Ruminococcaceae bacterium]|nr:hypothetical protein [Oscillospiraceae bacterium]